MGAIDFRLLGPLEVVGAPNRIDVEGPKQRALLAVLLINANRVVPADKLIDELWGEDPPPSAAKTLQTHVSRLRKALNGAASLDTRSGGYMLEVGKGQLDTQRFESLLEQGRRELAHGRPAEARRQLEEALALWRGPALADFAYEPFAQAEIARLEDLQLAAIEERNEADLRLGRHEELVGDLRTLVRRHPLRERLRAQLMLALYRCDRQAEALQAFEEGRQALAEELGLHPGESLRRLQQKILGHDPELAAPERASPPPVRAGRGRRVRVPVVALAGLAVVAAVGVIIASLVRSDGSGPAGNPTHAAGGELHLLDAAGKRVASLPVGRAPSKLAAGLGGLWVIDAEDRTLSKIDIRTRELRRTFSTGTTPTDVAVGAGAVWVANGFPRGSPLSGTAFPASVSRIDPASGVVEEVIDLPRRNTNPYFHGTGLAQQMLATTRDAVWVINPDFSLSRIDPTSNRVAAVVAGVQAMAVSAGDDGVWVVEKDGVTEIDTADDRVARRIRVPAGTLSGLAVGGGSVWAVDPLGGSVWRIDPDPTLRERTIDVGYGVTSVAYGAGAVWATTSISDEAFRIDPRTNKARRLPAIASPAGIAANGDGVWLASGTPTEDGALPCGPLKYRGAGDPDVRIVSSLPLQDDDRARNLASQRAIEIVLEQRGYRAGRFTVGYHSCDDAIAQGDTDPTRCFTNARAFARRRDVVGMIGSFYSGCSYLQIPVTNQAPNGPLAMISPTNTVIGLTRGWDGTPARQLEELYPTGRRNYFRVIVADHMAPLALGRLATELDRERLFVAWDGEDHDMRSYADRARRAAERGGARIVGRGGWDPHAKSFEGFARKIAAADPDGVMLVGAAPPNVRPLMRDLRRALGEEVPLLASDGFADFPTLSKVAGPYLENLYVISAGLPRDRLPRPAEDLLGEIEVEDLNAYYVHSAAAAQVLLDAIARSDGTRASVTAEVPSTRIEGGPLGAISFDAHGDVTEGPVSVFRLQGGRVTTDRVLTVSVPGN